MCVYLCEANNYKCMRTYVNWSGKMAWNIALGRPMGEKRTHTITIQYSSFTLRKRDKRKEARGIVCVVKSEWMGMALGCNAAVFPFDFSTMPWIFGCGLFVCAMVRVGRNMTDYYDVMIWVCIEVFGCGRLLSLRSFFSLRWCEICHKMWYGISAVYLCTYLLPFITFCRILYVSLSEKVTKNMHVRNTHTFRNTAMNGGVKWH